MNSKSSYQLITTIAKNELLNFTQTCTSNHIAFTPLYTTDDNSHQLLALNYKQIDGRELLLHVVDKHFGCNWRVMLLETASKNTHVHLYDDIVSKAKVQYLRSANISCKLPEECPPSRYVLLMRRMLNETRYQASYLSKQADKNVPTKVRKAYKRQQSNSFMQFFYSFLF